MDDIKSSHEAAIRATVLNAAVAHVCLVLAARVFDEDEIDALFHGLLSIEGGITDYVDEKKKDFAKQSARELQGHIKEMSVKFREKPREQK